MAVPAGATGSHLVDLPNEVLDLVIEKLGQQTALRNGPGLRSFRQTCKRVYQLAERYWIKQLRLTNPLQCRQLEFVLKRDNNRSHYVQSLEIIPDSWVSEDSAANSMLPFISRFTNLRVLKIAKDWVEDYDEQIYDTLEEELRKASLAELRSCAITTMCYSRCPVRTDRLLRAPKLVKLALDDLDLRKFPPHLTDNHSTALEELEIVFCRVDEASISAILSRPRSLKSLNFSGLHCTSHAELRDSGELVAEEQQTARMVVKVLSREQPNLHKLAITFRNVGEEDAEGQPVELHELKNLKQLTISGESTHNTAWCPASIMQKLPEDLEHLMIKSHYGAIDLIRLAGAVDVGGASQGDNDETNLPESLQRLEFLFNLGTRMLQCPFNNPDQQQDDELQKALLRLKNALSKSLLRVQYTQYCSLTQVREDGSATYHFWNRVLSTSSKSPIGVDASGNAEAVDEMVWEEELKPE